MVSLYTWYDAADDPIAAPITLTAEQGTTSAAVELRVWNKRGGTGASTGLDLLLEVVEVVDDLPLTAGTEALDQHHVEARLVAGLNQTISPVGWTRIGTARWLTLPPLPNDRGLQLEVRLAPPTHATSTQVRVNFHLIGRSGRPLPLGISEAAGDGIYHGLGDGGYSAIASTGGIAENPGGTDDEVQFGPDRYVYEGRPYALPEELVAFNDQDGAAAALGSGESYLVVATLKAGSRTYTKGLKGTTPVRPTPPVGELLLGTIEVPFGLTITTAEIANEWRMGFFGYRGATNRTITIGAGDAVAGNQLVHKDGEQQITLPDDDVSAVYLLPDGNLASTVDGSRPDDHAEHLCDVTVASNAVTETVDRRRFAPAPRTIELAIRTAGGMSANNFGQGANPFAREFGLLPTDPLVMWVHDFGTTPASGETRADVEHDADYDETWASIFAADADMPAVAFDATVARAPESSPSSLILPAGGRLRVRTDAVATAATAPSGLTVLLRGWPL